MNIKDYYCNFCTGLFRDVLASDFNNYPNYSFVYVVEFTKLSRTGYKVYSEIASIKSHGNQLVAAAVTGHLCLRLTTGKEFDRSYFNVTDRTGQVKIQTE